MWFLTINLCFFATKIFEVTTNLLILVTKKQEPLTAYAFMRGIKEQLQDQGKLQISTNAMWRSHIVQLGSSWSISICTKNSHPLVNFTMELAENSKLPLLGVEIIKHMSCLETTVYKKPTDTGLLVYYQSHVDVWYKQSLLKMMLNHIMRIFKLSSNWQLFHLEFEHLSETFFRLSYSCNQQSVILLLQSFRRIKIQTDVWREESTCANNIIL